MKMKNFWTNASLKSLGKWLEFYSTEGNPDDLHQIICLWNQGQFYFIIHKLSIIFIHLSISKKKKKRHADISTYGLLVKRPTVCVSMEIFMQLITGHSQNLSCVGCIFSYMTYNSHCIGLSFNFSIVLLSLLYQQRVLVIKHYEF